FVPHERHDLAQKVAAYEKRVGRKLDIVYTYHDMSLPEGTRREGQLLSPEEQAVGADRMLLLSWESKWWGGTKQQQPTWKQIASGQLDDTVIDVQARRVKEYGSAPGRRFSSPSTWRWTPAPRPTAPRRSTWRRTGTSTTGSGSWASTTS